MHAQHAESYFKSQFKDPKGGKAGEAGEGGAGADSKEEKEENKSGEGLQLQRGVGSVPNGG